LIKQAILRTVEKGTNFGSQHEDEGKLAELICNRFKAKDGLNGSIELLRFTNSGTEANLMAITAAKAIFKNKRRKVMVFEGGYHGGVFVFGKGHNIVNAPFDWVIAKYNDTESVEERLQEETRNGIDLAAILVEPMLGSGGAIPARREFLQYLRDTANRTGAVLIFDEVMTSRMFSGGGIQTEVGISPDMTTLGKYMGGGMSFGAFGGTTNIMQQFDPRTGPCVHAGTFNNNVLSMALGRVGLEQIFTPEVAQELHRKGEALRERLNTATKGTIIEITGMGSVMAFHFTDCAAKDIKDGSDVRWKDQILTDVLHLELLGQGIFIARRGFVALSLSVSEEDTDIFVKAVEAFVDKYREPLRDIRRGIY
jgi:glutamate-1-semialdehyde 2,1-aminomutase